MLAHVPSVVPQVEGILFFGHGERSENVEEVVRRRGGRRRVDGLGERWEGRRREREVGFGRREGVVKGDGKEALLFRNEKGRDRSAEA